MLSWVSEADSDLSLWLKVMVVEERPVRLRSNDGAGLAATDLTARLVSVQHWVGAQIDAPLTSSV